MRRQRLRSEWRDLPWRLIWHLSQTRVLSGVEVRVFESESTAGEIFERARAALEAISAADHVRMHKIRRDLKGILFTSTGGGAFLPRLKLCRIGVGYAVRVPSLELAMTIVHESTHARLFRVGCGYAAQEREAVERACVGAEVAFARKIPHSAPLIEKSLSQLDTGWWRQEVVMAEGRKQLVRLGWPDWIVRLFGSASSLGRTRNSGAPPDP